MLAGNAVCAPAPSLVSAVSRKVHGSVGPLDLRLFPALGAAKSEPRRGVPGEYQVVLTFSAPVTFSTPTTDGGTIASTTTAGNVVTVNLTGVPDQRTTTVSLPGTTSGGASATINVPLPVLIGDSNDDGLVNAGDAQQTKARSGQIATDEEGPRNFRSDLNCDGVINGGDAIIARANSGHPTSSAENQGRAGK